MLVELESMWDKVAFQTGWKIQTCTTPHTSSHPSTVSEESQNVSSNNNSRQLAAPNNIIINGESLAATNTAVDNNEHFLVEGQSLPVGSK